MQNAANYFDMSLYKVLFGVQWGGWVIKSAGWGGVG